MSTQRIRHFIASLTAASASLALAGCLGLGGGGGGFDCEAQSTAFDETASSQGQVQSSVPDDGPFPMAMVLSSDAINTMLTALLDQDLPEISDNTLAPLKITFAPQLPQVQIAAVEGCPSCIFSSLDFDIRVDTGILGAFNGAGSVTMSLPVALAPIDNSQTGLMAMMDQATFVDLSLEVGDLSTRDVVLVEELLEDLATEYVRSEFGSLEVLRLDSWKVGDDDMVLAARGPMIFPEQGTVVLGLHTNLILPSATTIEEQATLPVGSQLGLQIHPDLLLTAMQRLLNIGEIPQEYDADGNVDQRGDHQVTLSAMRAADGDKLNTSFRIWRTGGGLCGFADVSSDMSLRINSSFVELEAENFKVDGGEGIGELLADASSSWIASDFMSALTEQMALTINYREFGVEDGEGEGELAPQANEIVIDGRGLSVFMGL